MVLCCASVEKMAKENGLNFSDVRPVEIERNAVVRFRETRNTTRKIILGFTEKPTRY